MGLMTFGHMVFLKVVKIWELTVKRIASKKGFVLIMIKGASEEILEAQCCSSGNYQDWLVETGMKKWRQRRLKQINTNEWQAIIAASNSLRYKGDSDGRF